MKLSGLNLDTIRKEISKIRDLKTFKAEVVLLGQELKKLPDHLGPNAKKNLALVEKRYNDALKSIHLTQKQFDKEVLKARKLLDQTRGEVEKRLTGAKKAILSQRKKISKRVASQLKTAKPKRARRRKATGTATTKTENA
jgi:hypothetical protein